MSKLKCFKAYDVRGRVPSELNQELCRAIGDALCQIYAPRRVVLGQDTRLSSPALAEALINSLTSHGAHLFSLGLCGTEELYHAAATGNFDLGIMVTGSHNPADENGIKFVRNGAIPINSDSGLEEIGRQTAIFLRNPSQAAGRQGSAHTKSFRQAYIAWLIKYAGLEQNLSQEKMPHLRMLADAGNGCAGPVLTDIAKRISHEIIPINFLPDGTFPGGVPNPLLPEKRLATAEAVRRNRADLGIAFDGDFDRCFFYDHTGRFIDSCYVAGLLAAELLRNHPGEKVVHDIRTYWNTQRLIFAHNGQPVKSRAGHSFIKERMREENAIFGAELSGHYFYRDFSYCDSGMLTMLLMLSLLARTGRPLSELVEEGIKGYPCSGEINFRVADPYATIEAIWSKYSSGATYSDRLDGINIEFPDWRFNLRASNTEPLLRLNVESRSDAALVRKRLDELIDLIHGA